MPVLSVEHLSIRFGAGAAVVKDLSFSLEAHQTLALVGESGSGKSLTALSIMGLLPKGAVVEGAIELSVQLE